MFKYNFIKLASIASLLLLTISFTIYRLPVKSSLESGINNGLFFSETKVSQSDNQDINESTSRIYFSIFKFVSNLVPTGSR